VAFGHIKTKPAKKPGGRAVCEYQVNAFKDILNVIIPFFNANPLLTTKNLNYQDLVTVMRFGLLSGLGPDPTGWTAARSAAPWRRDGLTKKGLDEIQSYPILSYPNRTERSLQGRDE
jgi:hypothetical protein